MRIWQIFVQRQGFASQCAVASLQAIPQGMTFKARVNQPFSAGLDIFAGAVETAFHLGRIAAFGLDSPVLPVGPGEQQV